MDSSKRGIMTYLSFSCRRPGMDGNSREIVTGLDVRRRPSMFKGQK